MHLTRWLLSLLLLMTSSAFAQLLSYQQILDRPDRPQPDQRIAYGDDARQVGELWLPKGAGPHPVVLMIHGGCWLAALPGPELLAFQADALRAAGVAVWSISYRRVGHAGGGYPGTFQDVALGTDKLRSLAAQYTLDLNRVVATGHSAGGHLALWAAARPRIAAASPLHTASSLPIRAVVAVAGVPDLAFAASQGLCGDSVDKLMDVAHRGREAAVWADASPSALLPLGVKQVLMQGDRDRIVPTVNGERYRERAAPLGDAVDAVNLAEAGHFELIAPWTPAGRQVVERIVQAVDSTR